VLAGLLAILLLCGLGIYLYFGGPTPAEFDSPAGEGEAADEPAALPTTRPTDSPPPTEEPGENDEEAETDEPPGPTPAVEDAAAIEGRVVAFDEAMRHALQTGDTSTLGGVARGAAYDDRIRALDILRQAGDCLWVYDHRGMDVFEIEAIDDTHAKVMANVDRGGEVVCAQPDKSYPEYAFSYVYTAVYVTEYADGQWYVTEYCPYNNCPDYLKD
jgi:hypothetical protein